MNRKFLSLFLFIVLAAPAFGQEADSTGTDKPLGNWVTTAQLEARVDWQRDWLDGTKRAEESGFRGQYLNFILKGELGKHWSYAYRQRFSKELKSGFFNATDWLYLTYNIKKWEMSAGKQVVGVGGFEYDYAPIDVYQYSEYCNNIGCYQFGASVAYNLTPNDRLQVQATQSPFRANADDMYGFGVKWDGKHGPFTALYSANLFEATPGHWINYIALGNRFDFSRGHFIVDWTNRYAGGYDANFFGDFTLTTELHVQPIRELNAFIKYGWDRNKKNGSDYCVFAGTEQHHLGGGVEYFPLKGRRDLRLHASYFHTWGENTNPAGVLQDKESTLNIGLTFRADLLHLKKQFTGK